MRWLDVVAVAVGGGAGSLVRYGISSGVQRLLATNWPAGTLAVNALGCLLFGLGLELLRLESLDRASLRLLWLTGFCGGLTTFSSYAFDVYALVETRGWAWAALNAAAHLVAGGALLVAGAAVGRIWTG